MSRWATVRVEDTGDGLIIHPDDAVSMKLDFDSQYEGYFLPDGSYRIKLDLHRSLVKGDGETCPVKSGDKP